MPDDDVTWAAERAGRDVVAREPLTGGMTSTLEVLTFQDGGRAVLRLIDREPWVRHRAALVEREALTQRELATTPVRAPRSLAVDAAHGRHLMTLLPGAVVEDLAPRHLERLAAALADVHVVRPVTRPREYQSWAWEAKFVVPDWAVHPEAWRDAFDLLRTDPPGHEPTFLHRDFQHRNVLWEGDRVSGVVDWVETSTGPAWLDVAHAATNLALHVGAARPRRSCAPTPGSPAAPGTATGR